jgi:hypothetical protein
MLEYIDAHPWILGYVIVPVAGWALSIIAPSIVMRWPSVAPVLDALMHQLPAIPGTYAKIRKAAKDSTTPPTFPGDKT